MTTLYVIKPVRELGLRAGDVVTDNELDSLNIPGSQLKSADFISSLTTGPYYQSVKPYVFSPVSPPPAQGGGSPTISPSAAGDAQFTVNFGSRGDAPAQSDDGPASLIALTKRQLTKTPELGQASANGSVPVVIALDQGPLEVTLEAGSELAQDGADATGIAPPAGGSGIRGWLSGIYAAIRGTLKVDGSGVVQPVSGSAAVGAAPAQPPLSVSGVDGGGLKRHLLTDASGRLITAAGSSGFDFSANLAVNSVVIPNVGAAFAASGPYGGYTLVKTLPALASRAYAEVDNLSAGQIVVIRDDGSAPLGSAPSNASVIVLNAAPAVGQPGGGGWTTTTFKGRVQIYAPAGTTPLVTAFQD